ncbi:MAG: hypothetical protein KDA96_19230, partial [Planctomycetaceae bacterium]|nr:hypothetical protein [Planctomycetaceae bacterium]
RGLALDPEWKVISIDARKTVFAAAADHQATARIRKASRVFYALEFPGSNQEGSLEGVLALGSPGDSCRVAAVLNALRFPYAALRVLPAESSAEAERIRTRCYAELALRIYQQSGIPSLVTHFRATSRLRAELSSITLLPREREHIRQILDSLSDRPLDSTSERNRLLSEAEAEIRSAIAAGDQPRASQLLSKSGRPPWAAWYQMVMETQSLSAPAILDRLQELQKETELPADLRAEILFESGCIAIEAGDPVSAVSAFESLLKSEEPHPSKDLAAFYLLNLSGR